MQSNDNNSIQKKHQTPRTTRQPFQDKTLEHSMQSDNDGFNWEVSPIKVTVEVFPNPWRPSDGMDVGMEDKATGTPALMHSGNGLFMGIGQSSKLGDEGHIQQVVGPVSTPPTVYLGKRVGIEPDVPHRDLQFTEESQFFSPTEVSNLPLL